MMWWKKLLNQYEQYTYEQQLVHFLNNWLKKIAATGTIIHFDLRTHNFVIIKEAPRVLKSYHGTNTPHLRVGYEARDTEQVILDTHDVVLCVAPSEFDTYVMPLISLTEWQAIFDVTSEIITAHVCGGLTSPRKNIAAPLIQPGLADVVLWVDGRVRGSVVVGKATLYEAVIESARQSVADGRFPPLCPDELSRTTIEIFLISQLALPIKQPALTIPAPIDINSSYHVTGNGNSGWYVPTVHKTSLYSDRPTLLTSLAYEKAHISQVNKRPVFFQYPTIAAMRPLHTKTLFPIANSLLRSPALNNDNHREHLQLLLGWVTTNQHTEGYWPLYTSPYHAAQPHMDWVRNALLVWSLTEFAIHTNNVDLAKSASRGHEYITKKLGSLRLPPEQKALTHIYLAKAALAQKYVAVAEQELQNALKLVNTWDASIFFKTHACGVAQSLKRKGTNTSIEIPKLLNTLVCEWQQALHHPSTHPLAAFAELIPILYIEKSSEASADITRTYESICIFMLSYQQKNGAFNNTPTHHVPYSRGTSKVAEALAIDPAHQNAVDSALRWIWSLQFLAEDLYTVPIEKRGAMLGGVRHDYANHTAWIDTAAHTLLAITRQSRHNHPQPIQLIHGRDKYN